MEIGTWREAGSLPYRGQAIIQPFILYLISYISYLVPLPSKNRKEPDFCPENAMLEFVAILLPGVIFAYAAEALMKRRLTTHYFLFLAAFNILALNVASLVLRNFIADFLSADGYALASGNMEYATALLKQIIYACLAGIPLCLVEAFIGKYIHLSLDDTKKEEDKHG